MPNDRHAAVPAGTWFFTLNLRRPERDLLVLRVVELRAAFAQVRAERPFMLLAIVVLPAHLHCVWRLPDDDVDNAARWRQLKTCFVRALPAAEQRSARRCWPRRPFQQPMRSARELERHIDYIHFNPVQHGLASRVVDWPHSSFHRAVRAGLLPADWAGEARHVDVAEQLPARLWRVATQGDLWVPWVVGERPRSARGPWASFVALHRAGDNERPGIDGLSVLDSPAPGC